MDTTPRRTPTTVTYAVEWLVIWFVLGVWVGSLAF
jgi:hypothetical protein